MKHLINNIRQFFVKPVAPQTLAFFRIAVCSFALVQILVLLPDWMWFYGPEGIVPWNLSEPLSSTHMPTLGNVLTLFGWTHISANGVVCLVTGIYIVSLIALLIGYKSNLMGFLALLMQTMLNTTSHFTAYGVETFLHMSLFYCTVLPVGVTWSIDALKRKSGVPAYLVTLGVRLIQIHLCIMYLSCGIEKACGVQWWSGEAIWIAMQQDQFHKVNIDWMAQYPLLPKLLCWSTIVIEGMYPIGIYWKKTRKFWFMSIISMHAFIAIFLGLQLFGAMMILLNISLFGIGIFKFRIRSGSLVTPQLQIV